MWGGGGGREGEYVGGGGGGKLGRGESWDLDPGRPLKSCLKNRSKITARNERFFKQDLSGFSKKPPKPLKSCWKTAQILSGF